MARFITTEPGTGSVCPGDTKILIGPVQFFLWIILTPVHVHPYCMHMIGKHCVRSRESCIYITYQMPTAQWATLVPSSVQTLPKTIENQRSVCMEEGTNALKNTRTSIQLWNWLYSTGVCHEHKRLHTDLAISTILSVFKIQLMSKPVTISSVKKISSNCFSFVYN